MSDAANRADSRFGALLRHYRGLRGMTQAELAERAGLNLQAISMLERGLRRAPRSTTVEFLAEALKLDVQQREAFLIAAWGRPDRKRPTDGPPVSEPVLSRDTPARLAEAQALLASMPTETLPEHGPLPAGSRMPLAPNPLFVGRRDELLAVASALGCGDRTVGYGQVVASTGLGGLGKTQLVVEFVHRYGQFFAGGVSWLSFATADEVPLQVADCAAPGLELRPLEERVRRVKDLWQSAMPRLLVFDNCEEEALLDAWRPPSGGCRVLVTSRRSHWSPTLGVAELRLDLLPRSDSIHLLCRYRPDLASDASGLDAIAEELGDLPLALHLAGSYLRNNNVEVGLDDYLVDLRRSDVVQHVSLLGACLDDSPSPTRHMQGVAQTFELCLGRLDPSREIDRVAIALLARMAYMAPGELVPHDLLNKTLEEVGPLPRAFGLRRLIETGLVEQGEDWLRMHPLVVHFLRHRDLDGQARSAVDRALIGYSGGLLQRSLLGQKLVAVIPHFLEASSRDADQEDHLAQVFSATGVILTTGLNELALVLRDQGDPAAARPLFERALAIRERVLGPDHPDTLATERVLAEMAAEGKDRQAAEG